jgi:hypothetical protein
MKIILCLTLLCVATAQAQYNSAWSEFDAGSRVNQAAATANRGVLTSWLRLPMQSANYTMQQGLPVTPVPAPVIPILAISRVGSNVRVSWPLSAASFVLQSSPVPVGSSWSNIRGPYQSNATEWFIAIPPSQPNQFYRLTSSP